MARTLDFTFAGETSACGLEKVDRRKLYGYVDSEVLDGADQKCELATLASDGRTIIPAGGIGLATFSPDGRWLDKSDLSAVDLEGNPIEPVESSFNAPIALEETASIEEYLSHNIRMVYALSAEDGISGKLLAELAAGKIFKFDFSYRGGLTADPSFLLEGKDGSVWMAVGSPTDIEFISYEQVGFAVPPDEDADEEDDGIDFGMM